MCILLCFEPTPPCATVACPPKVGAAAPRIRVQPKPDTPGPRPKRRRATSPCRRRARGPGPPAVRPRRGFDLDERRGPPSSTDGRRRPGGRGQGDPSKRRRARVPEPPPLRRGAWARRCFGRLAAFLQERLGLQEKLVAFLLLDLAYQRLALVDRQVAHGSSLQFPQEVHAPKESRASGND